MSVKVNIDLQKKIGEAISKSEIDKLGRALQRYIREKIIIQRIKDGMDLSGQSFGGYNKSYDKKKSFNYATRKFGRTKYASNSENDKLQLTGHLLSGIQVTFVSSSNSVNKINMKFLINVRPELEPQQIGLESTSGSVRTKAGIKKYAKKAWHFLGISKRLGEDKKILRFIQSYLGKRSGKLSTTEN